MSATLTAPDLRDLTDDQLAEAWAAADVDDPSVYAAFLAEFDQRAAAERTARMQAGQQAVLAEGYDAAYAQYLKASEWCRGRLLSDLGRKRVTDEMSLWTGSEEAAMRYASEELRDFWMFVEKRMSPGRYARQRGAHVRIEREAAQYAAEIKGETTDGNDADTAGPGLADPDTSPLRHVPVAEEAPQAGPRRAVQRGGPGHDGTEDTEDSNGAGRPRGPVQPQRVEAGERGDMTITAVEAEALGCDHATGPNPRFGTPRQCGKCPAKGRTLGGAPRRHADGDEQEPTDEEIYGAGGDGTPPRPQARPADEGPATIRYGTHPLEIARKFAAKILWAPDYMLDALTLFVAASHVLDSWNSGPRLLGTSAEGLCGKSTLLQVVRLLGLNVWSATQATSYALKSKFNDRERPLILVDEASDIFGLNGRSGQHNPVATVARDCYVRTATVSISNNRTAEDIPAFCFMAIGGRRNAVPYDVWTRCIEFKMKRVPESVNLELDALDPDTDASAGPVRTMLHQYMRAMLAGEIKRIQRRFVPPHPKFRDRLRQIWLPLYATALAADAVEKQRYEAECDRCEREGLKPPELPITTWAKRCMTAFKAMALDASDLPVLTAEQMALRDVAAYARTLPPAARYVFTSDARDWLRDSSGEELWEKLTDGKLARAMVDGIGQPTVRARPDDPAHKAKCWPVREVLAEWDALERALTPTVATMPEDDGASLFDDEINDDDEGNASNGTLSKALP